MSRTIQAQGESLTEALTAAIAELGDTEPEKVDLTLEASGLEDLTGQVRLDLHITPSTASAADASPDDEGPSARVDEAGGDEQPVRAPSSERASGDGGHDDEELSAEDLDEEADAAADFLEGLLDAMDLPGDLRIHVHEDHAEVEIIDLNSGALIGRRGQTLESVQELLRCALQRQFQRRCRVKVDAEGYRARRLEKLLEKADEALEEVLESGEAVRLEPMDVFERKAVHNLVAEDGRVTSRSQGREPARRVVVEPLDA